MSQTKNTPHNSIIAQNSKKVNTKTPSQPPNCPSIHVSAASSSPNSANSTAEVTPSDWVYSEIVKEHFLSPKNFLMGDETQFACDAVGVAGNPVCGDQMKMFLCVKDDIITDLKWKTYGCASAIASTSALSELAKGRTLDAALEIGPAEIADYLGGLPAHKFHCSVLGHEALAAAIKNYRSMVS